ncbi:MAG: hypothetical protein IPM79_11570 [Polyangiaceae bacterium]|jgi:hypothetical protein|nr:hypothetical protein [Polyangiaceae bacterium]
MTHPRFTRARWLPLFLALGCSDTIEVVTGGSGAGGNPSTSVGGGGAGAGVTGGANAGGAAGIGGDPISAGGAGMGGVPGTGGSSGNACADACAFVATCGVPEDQCTMYLDCGNPQGECAADCVNQPGVTCDALFAALQGAPGPLSDCLGACQGGGMGGGGVGGAGMGGGGVGGGGMGSPMECQQCAQNNCSAQLQQCFQAGGCQSWVQCAQACQDQACLDDCSMMNPSGAPVGTCLCTSCLDDGCGYTCD